MTDRFVIDGDTLVEPDGTRTRIAGVDSPETFKVKAGKVQFGQPGAQTATDILREQVAADPTLETKPTGETSYDRQVGSLVDAQGNDLSQYLVGVGAARPTRFSDQAQIDAESTALARSQGIGEIIDNPAARADQQRMQDSLNVKGATTFDPFNGAQAMRGNDLNTFGAAANRGADQTQGLLYSAANAFGEATGVDAIAKWGEAGFKQQMLEAAANPPKLESFDDVKSLSDFGTYVVEALGEQLPNIALMATGAGVGAGTAGLMARATIGKAVLGRLAGTSAASYPLAVGEVQQELKGAGIDAPGTAFVAGIPIAALDAVGFEAMIGRFFGKASKEVSHGIIKEVSAGLMKSAGVGAATEVPTEMAQELLAISAHAYHDPSFEIFSDENVARIKEAGVKAGIVGAVAGGGGGVVHSAVTYKGKADDTVPPQNTSDTKPTTTDPAGQPNDVTDPLAPETKGSPVAPPFAPDAGLTDLGSNDARKINLAEGASRTGANEPNTTQQAYQPDDIDAALRTEFEALKKRAERSPLQTPTDTASNEAQQTTAPIVTPSPLATPLKAAPKQTRPDDSVVTKAERASIESAPKIQKYDEARITAGDTETITADVVRKGGEARSGIAKIVASLFPGATAVDPKDATKNWSVQVNLDEHQDSKDYDGDTQRVVAQAIKVFADGRTTENKRVTLETPDGKTTHANWMEITRLGSELSGRPVTNDANALVQGRANFAEGVAWLMDKGYKFPKALNKNTEVYRTAGGKPVTFGELSKVEGYVKPRLGEIRKLETAIAAEKNTDKKRVLNTRLKRKVQELMKYGPSDSPNKVEAAHEQNVESVAGDPKSFDASVESEADQASKSSSLRQHGNKSKQAKPYLSRYRETAAELLTALGFNDIRLDIMNERVARDRLDNKNTPKQERADIEAWLKSGKKGRIVARPGEVPMVFISAKNGATDAQQLTVMLHELGHLVQFTSLDQAPQKVQDALREASGTKNDHEFGEWFANQLGYWVARRKVPRGIVQKYFHGLAKKLKSLFDFITKKEGLNQTYADFMDTMVGYRMSTLSKVKPKTDFGKQLKKDIDKWADSAHQGNTRVANFEVREAVSNAISERRLQRLVEMKDHIVSWLLKAQPLVQTADGYLRGLKSAAITGLADHFHHAVGTERTVGITISQETRSYAGPQAEKMHEILGRVDNMSEKDRNTMIEELITQQENVTSQEGKDIRDYFNGMYALLTQKLNLKFKHRKNYFPLTIDMLQWAENRDAIISTIAKNYNDDQVVATHIYEEIRDAGGQFSQEEDGKLNLAGPSFGNMKARNLTPEFVNELSKYFVRDVHAVMVAYTHAAIRRGVIEKRFGIKTAKEHETYSQFAKQAGIHDVDLSSPLAKFAMAVRLAESRGEITPDEASRVLNKILPAYMGRLGADIDPALRHLNSWGVLYQNIRLLGLSVLSSFVDIGTIMYRSGKPLKTLTTALEGVLSKAKRADMIHAAKMMGEIRDDVADHVLNDQMTAEFMSPKAAKINDWFFRKIGMQAWTNYTRAVALSMGKHVLNATPTKAQMKELGITHEELSAWRAAGSPTNIAIDSEHENVIGALHQFVDESVIRPEAPIRPVWGSDPRFMLIWHLKSFIYGFQKQILDRVWEQTKAKPWPTKALPLITLGLALMPFAAAGYELRRFLTGANGNSRELQGWEYAGELMQRSGATGLLQFMIDAEETNNRGRMGIVALGGPTVEQFTTAMTKDWNYLWTHGTPIFAQSPAARAWARD